MYTKERRNKKWSNRSAGSILRMGDAAQWWCRLLVVVLSRRSQEFTIDSLYQRHADTTTVRESCSPACGLSGTGNESSMREILRKIRVTILVASACCWCKHDTSAVLWLTMIPFSIHSGRRLLLIAAFLELVKNLQCEQYFGRNRLGSSIVYYIMKYTTSSYSLIIILDTIARSGITIILFPVHNVFYGTVRTLKYRVHVRRQETSSNKCRTNNQLARTSQQSNWKSIDHNSKQQQQQ